MLLRTDGQAGGGFQRFAGRRLALSRRSGRRAGCAEARVRPNVRPTRIPSSWQSQFADLRDYAGVAWYWRTITADPPAADQMALLRFGAVDYAADVYVNGQKAGSHEGGYLPFEIDVTSLLHAGENQVAVRVTDPGAKPHEVVEGISYAEIPMASRIGTSRPAASGKAWNSSYRPRVRLGSVHISANPDGAFVITAPVVVWEQPAQSASPRRSWTPAARACGRARRMWRRGNKRQAQRASPRTDALEHLEPQPLRIARLAEFGRFRPLPLRFPQLHHARRQILFERQTHLSTRGTGPGLLPRHDLHAALARLRCATKCARQRPWA
jgi:hypothetical protein